MTRGRLPDFFVIGVVKGGTTSLYTYLDQHPEIFVPRIKETNHFAAADIQHQYFLPTYAKDVDIDLNRYFKKGMPEVIHIAHVDSTEHYRQLFDIEHNAKRIGDVSNSYMICPSSAEAIHSHDPESRIIVVLRNPISRAWSQYLMNIREAKVECNGLIEEFEHDRKRPHTGWGVSHQYLELGHYAEQLNRYYELFPKDQVHVVLYEDYRKDPEGVLKRICHFLQVDGDFSFDFSEQRNRASRPRSEGLNRALVNTGILQTVKGIVPRSLREKGKKLLYTEKGLPEMTEPERDYLIGYYQEEVDALEKLLGRQVKDLWPEFQKEA